MTKYDNLRKNGLVTKMVNSDANIGYLLYKKTGVSQLLNKRKAENSINLKILISKSHS